jgi:hypothetical protein
MQFARIREKLVSLFWGNYVPVKMKSDVVENFAASKVFKEENFCLVPFQKRIEVIVLFNVTHSEGFLFLLVLDKS